MNQYFIYVRKSTDEADRQVLSIDAQLSIINDFVKRQGFQIKEVFRESQSAMKPGRPIFNEMMKQLEHGHAKGVIAHKTDRLSRNDTDSAKIFDLMNKGHEIIFVDTPVVNNAIGRATLGMQLVWAKFYSENLAEEVKKGMKEKVKQGGWPNLAPTGYLNSAGEVTLDEKRAPFIKRAFELYAKDNISLEELSQVLYTDGFRSRNNEKVLKSSLHQIFSNPFYYGKMNWDGQSYEGGHIPIVTYRLWQKVQDVLHKKTRPHPISYRFTFRGFFTCGECRCSITAQLSKGHTYYRCTKAKHKKCQQPYIREEDLTRELEKVIKEIQIDKPVIELMKREMQQVRSSLDGYRNKILKSLHLRQGKLEAKKKNLWNLRIEDNIPEDIFKEKLKEIVSEEDDIRDKLKNESNANNRWYENCSSFIESAFKLYQQFKVGTLSTKRHILECVCSNLILKDKKIVKITYKKPFDVLVQNSKRSEWWTAINALITFFQENAVNLDYITQIKENQ